MSLEKPAHVPLAWRVEPEGNAYNIITGSFDDTFALCEITICPEPERNDGVYLNFFNLIENRDLNKTDFKTILTEVLKIMTTHGRNKVYFDLLFEEGTGLARLIGTLGATEVPNKGGQPPTKVINKAALEAVLQRLEK